MNLVLDRLWDQQNRTLVLVICAGMIALIAIADWLTAPYLSLGFLYLFPVMLAAGFQPRPSIVALGVVCALLSEAFSSLNAEGRIVRLIFEILALSASGLFVSELVRSRRLTRQTQERLRVLINTSPAAIVLADRSGVIELANRAADDFLLPALGSLLGQSIYSFLPELRNAFGNDGARNLRTSMQCEVHRGDDEKFIAEMWFSTWREKGQSKLAAIIGQLGDQPSDNVRTSIDAENNGVDRPRLNDRQATVLRLVFEGHSNREISSRLDLTSSAVKNTIQQLFAKTGVNSRSQMVRVALERYHDLL